MDLQQTIATYCRAWGEPDPDARNELLRQVWAGDGEYSDPSVRLHGRSELSACIAAVLQKVPGARIVQCGPVDGHGMYARFPWEFQLPDGRVHTRGVDFAELGEDDRIRRITGFFD